MEEVPLQWSRETPWRQGHVLCAKACAALGLSDASDANPAATCVVVVSHDCDLAIDDLRAEPDVEVIAGCVVAAPNGNFSWGKSSRTLHLPMYRNGIVVTVELIATRKRLIRKDELAFFKPDGAFALSGKELDVLRSWLSVRYRRAAFPDAFVRRMQAAKVDEKLAKKLEPKGSLVSSVYFDLDDGQVLERRDGDPYNLSIVLVYSPGDDAEKAASAADDLADVVRDACEARLTDKTQIIIKRCFAISEDDLTISSARTLSQWRLEYMTFKASHALQAN